MAKEKARYFTFPTLSRFNSRRLGNEIEIDWCNNSGRPLHDKDLSDVEGQLYKKHIIM